ncbi:hypothetical protein GO986_09080 [Deinococcus sp. HMF7620]|uniref:Uncharacterized protein n=1 Tax=Deinococcus arboris TaxID=2682977 RepID=A0A7C9LLW7_9DEIO|nr:hypothetical protein [Deinococcus arboris]MVN86917.1 hypothetical protein [Deinococcus arboris]
MAEWSWHEFLEWLDGCCCRGELPAGSCVWGVVVAAFPGAVTVRLDTGQAVRASLAPGAFPRPGQRMQVCRDGAHHTDRRTMHQPRRPTHTEDDAGVFPQTASYDSPQRLALDHVPTVAPDGTFLGGGSVPSLPVMTLDDGQLHPLGANAVNHLERWVEWLEQVSSTSTPPDLTGLGIRSQRAWTVVTDPAVAIHEQLLLSGGSDVVQYALKRQNFDGSESSTPLTVSAPWRIYKTRLMTQGDIVTDYRLREKWERLGPTMNDPDGPNALWRRERAILMMHPHGWEVIDEAPYNFTRLSISGVDKTRAQWEADGTPPNPTDPALGLPFFRTIQQASWLVDAPLPPQTPVPSREGPRFRAPGVTIFPPPGNTAAYTTDHARLEEGARLLAGGQELTGGSWAALCGPVNAQGVPEVWVLHTADDTDAPITLVRPGGGGSLPRDRFEREILRVQVGTFRRFHPSGTLTHSWPPHWALCECGAGVITFSFNPFDPPTLRAVGLYDPWRDSRGGLPPEGSTDPAWWWWEKRPKQRPKVLPPDAPVAPLRLALMDVFLGAGPTNPGGSS